MNKDTLQINKISFSYENSPIKLFDEFSVDFTRGWTVLAGGNGTGKTTLLKLLAGFLKLPCGNISFEGNCIYCPQEAEQEPANFYEAFFDRENQTKALFSRLNIFPEQYERWKTLSGGEKKRIQIACTLAEKPQVLLLDEPTNHLDEKTNALILSVLKTYDGIGIIVSHDRHFTDSLCDYTVFLYKESSYILNGKQSTAVSVYTCGLSKALEIRKEQQTALRKNWNNLTCKAAAEKTLARKWLLETEQSKARLSKKNIVSKQDHDTRAKMDLARLSGKDRTAGDTKSRFDSRLAQTQEKLNGSIKTLQRKEGFHINGDIEIPKFRFSMKEKMYDFTADNGFAYSLSIPALEITENSRITLCGTNGSGKTLFIRKLISELERKHKTEQILYLPQEIRQEEEQSILLRFAALQDMQKGEVLSTLYRLGSDPENVYRSQIGNVSPGELRKLVIAMGITSQVSFLILDEPTNHLDITSITAIENALEQIECALLVVSHDKMFLEKITTQQWYITRKNNSGILKCL